MFINLYSYRFRALLLSVFDYLILLPNNEELFKNLGFDHADINIY